VSLPRSEADRLVRDELLSLGCSGDGAAERSAALLDLIFAADPPESSGPRVVQLEQSGYVMRYTLDEGDPQGYAWTLAITLPEGRTIDTAGKVAYDARDVIYQASMTVLGVESPVTPTPLKETDSADTP
jgi:hypothetical protein